MILDKLFQLMSEKHASDIFISAGAPIHIKIQGNTIPVNQQVMLPDMIEKIAYELMSPDQIKTFEANWEMNLSFGVPNVGNFRVNIFRQRGSTSIVIRFILGNIPALDELGLPNILGELIMEKRGLILIVGATGSGKSTTIASMLDHRNANRSGHILTVEDPIEFLFKHKKSIVNQREIGMDTQDWQSALKNAMRQAPDCILIGEIRDKETMQAAIAYAQTGHLCLATLHANNSYQALNRILSFYPVEVRSTMLGDLSSALKTIVSQRLVRNLKGERMAAVEVLLNTKLVAELIERGDFSGVREAMEKSMADGSQTFEQDLARLITEKRIGRKEGLAHADSPNNLMWRLQNDSVKAIDTLAASREEQERDAQDAVPSFTEIVLDVKFDA